MATSAGDMSSVSDDCIVTILPPSVIEKLAELDLELSEGKTLISLV